MKQYSLGFLFGTIANIFGHHEMYIAVAISIVVGAMIASFVEDKNKEMDK